MAILSKACKPDHFELHNSLKLSFANIWGLRSNFVVCKSFFEWNSPDILALCEINLDDSIDSGNFSVRGFLPLIRKDSSTYMHDLAVMWRRDFLLHGTYLWKTLQIPTYVCFGLALLCSVFNFSFLYQSPSSSLCMVISNDLTQMVNFPTQITDWNSHSPAYLDFFLSSDVCTCSAKAFPPLGNSDHVVVSVSIDFLSYSQQNALFHRIAYGYSCGDWEGLCNHFRDVSWEDISKLSASAGASEFCEWVQAGIDIHISHWRY